MAGLAYSGLAVFPSNSRTNICSAVLFYSLQEKILLLKGVLSMKLTNIITLNKNHLYTALLIICVSLVISGCGGSKNVKPTKKAQPDWILNTPSEPGALYGVGSATVFGGNEASAMARAKDVARVELVKQITVNVSGEIDQEISETMTDGASSLTENLRQAVKSKVPEFKLTHVSQEDSHKGGKHAYALVKLDVAQELKTLRRQINDIDMQLDEYSAKFTKEDPHGMSAIRLIAPALVLVDQRADLQARHNALSPSTGGASLLTEETRDFIAKVYDRIGQMSVTVVSEDQENSNFQTALIASLNEKGMRIVTEGKADVQIVYKLSTNNVDRKGTIYSHTSGDITIKDETGRVVKAFQAKTKGTSTDAKEAESRSIKKLSTKLSKGLMSALF